MIVLGNDKKLLLRVALRLEKAAKDKFAAAAPDRHDEAKRTRDHELGDVSDLRGLAARLGSIQSGLLGDVYTVDGKTMRAVLAPLEATEAMVQAWVTADDEALSGEERGRAIWAAMVKAIEKPTG